MKKLLILLCFLFYTLSAYSLSVTGTPSNLSCGSNAVTFTFDCNFSGSILIPTSITGVSYSGSNIKSVTNGQLNFTVSVTTAAPQNFSLNFVVLSSDMTSCAAVNDSAAAAFSHTCILPPNNDCSGAIALAISTNACSSSNYITTNATSSGSNPNCAVPGYLDLFYTFNANNDTVIMEIPAVPGTVGFYGLYDNCPSSGGNQVGCSIIISSQNTSFPLTGLTVGQDYFIQLLFLPGNAGIDQQICLHNTTSAPPPPTCISNVIVSDAGPNFTNVSYQTSQTITTSGVTTISASDIIYDAGTEITLNAGFETLINTVFEAKIGGCTP